MELITPFAGLKKFDIVWHPTCGPVYADAFLLNTEVVSTNKVSSSVMSTSFGISTSVGIYIAFKICDTIQGINRNNRFSRGRMMSTFYVTG